MLLPALKRRTKLNHFPHHLNYYSTGKEFDVNKPRAVSEYDVVIVGAGPAGLSAAIRLKQLDASLSVVVIEKASQIGGHTLSGAVLEPRALNELIPNWSEFVDDKCPLETKVKKDKMRLLSEKYSIPLPIPPVLQNHENFIISLSEFVGWLGRRAEADGIEIYPGFGGSELIFKNEKVVGVATNDVGLDKQGNPKRNFERGLELHARKALLLAEGCHGSLSKKVIEKFKLRTGKSHQTYGLGFKEVWEIPEENHQEGHVVHSIGWPLKNDTYGGSFMYQYKRNLVSIGLVIGLDYSNPFLNLYKEFQRTKLHPIYRNVLENGKCVAYGARALNEGGWQSIPKLNFPGGALIGCSAGFLNVPKIKGTHTAMKSGIIAAESIFEESIENYEKRLKESWVGKELYQVRNVRPSFHHFGGLLGGLIFSGLDTIIFKGRLPFTLSHGNTPDHLKLKTIDKISPNEQPNYLKPDGKITFELLESVSRTGTNHEEDQPCHLELKSGSDAKPQLEHNLKYFAGPEQRFCPAGVYEYLETVDNDTKDNSDNDTKPGMKFQINSQNCIHCKTCDIKDPSQNINWKVPEGGGGPQYTIT